MSPLTVKKVISMGAALALLAVAPAHAQGEAELTQEQRLEIETLLDELGFDPGDVDGVIDEDSRFAIRAYQDFAALTPDGEVDMDLLRELRSIATILADLPPVEESEAPADTPPQEPSLGEAAPEPPETAASPAQDPEPAEAEETETTAVPPRAAQKTPDPPAQKPEPPPAEKPPVPEPSEKGSGFDLGGLLTELSTSGRAAGATAAGDDDAATRQQALYRAQNRELFAEAYDAGKYRKYGLAIGSYEDLVERPGLSQEEKAVVFFNLGNLWMKLANNLRALESYDSALELAPEFREAHHNRAVVLKRLGQEREAEKAVAEAKRLGLAWDGQPRASFQSLAPEHFLLN